MRPSLFTGSLLLLLSFHAYSQVHCIYTDAPRELLSKSSVSQVHVWYRKEEMKTDSLLSLTMINNRGLAVFQKFRVNHTLNIWGIRKVSISPDSTTGDCSYFSFYNGKEELAYQYFEHRPKHLKWWVKIIREFDRGLHTIDTLYGDPEMKNQLILAIHKGDTVRRIRNLRTGDLLLYSVKEKKDGTWKETEKMETTYKKDGGFDTFKHYKNGVLFNSYNYKDVENNKIRDNNGLEHDVHENPLPPDDRFPKMDTLYTKDPNAASPVFSKKSFPGAYLWVDHYDHNGKDVFLSEVFDHRGLIVLKWHRNSGEKYIFKYTVRNPKPKRKE